jgi:formiminotetrahydrofolate cyclodeaminase
VASSAERSLAELLRAVSERSPAPSAGSAAAWSGALAASLLEMAAGYAGTEDAARARELRGQLLEAGERDLSAYEPVLAATRLDPGDPSRAERLGDALSRASEPPLMIARAAAEVAERAAAVAGQSSAPLAGDALAGVLLAEAAAQSAARLVEINISARRDDPRLGEVARLVERAAAARARTLAR